MQKKKTDEKVRVIVKKARGHQGSHHGGAWKVAYADFVTAMMALFIVLWIIAASDDTVKVGLAQYFRDPGIFKTSQGILPDMQGGISGEDRGKTHPLEELQGRLTKELQETKEFAEVQDQILISLGPDGLLIEFTDKEQISFFDLGSAKLSPMLARILAHLVKQLGPLPNKIVISGHTDSRPFQNKAFYSNWELSAARALNTRRTMEELGFDSTRVEKVTGHADRSPLIKEDPANAANRRISILVLGAKNLKGIKFNLSDTEPRIIKDPAAAE
jgi:chemotaxis protein MotB